MKKTCPNLNAGHCIAQPRTHTRTPGNTPGLGLEGYAGRRMKPARRLGFSCEILRLRKPAAVWGVFREVRKYAIPAGHFDADLVSFFVIIFTY